MFIMNKRVLITAPSNSAVDNIAEKLLYSADFQIPENQIYRLYSSAVNPQTVQPKILVSSEILQSCL